MDETVHDPSEMTLFCAMGINNNMYIYRAHFVDAEVWTDPMIVRSVDTPQGPALLFGDPFPFMEVNELNTCPALKSPFIFVKYKASQELHMKLNQAMTAQAEQLRAQQSGITIVGAGQSGIPKQRGPHSIKNHRH